MKKADNRAMLNFLKRNEAKNYYTLERIANAGSSGYGIKRVEFLTENGFPSEDYIELCENIAGELTVSKSYNAEFGVFAFLGDKRTFSFVTPECVTPEYITNPKTLKLKFDNAVWDDLQTQIDLGRESDLLTLVYWEGALCGYLLANNSYENYYDVSNVFVLPEYRGKGIGIYVTQFFMKYCFRMGFVPHYGTAVSSYSERVAKRAGFTETGRTHYASVKPN